MPPHPPHQQRRAQMQQIPPAPGLPGLELFDETGDVLVIDVPDGSLFNDFNMTEEEEENLIGDADMTGPEGDEEDQLQTNGNTRDIEETSDSEQEKENEGGRCWRYRSERQTATLATATVPPPQVASHQGPPQQVASHQGPSPQVASYQGPPPQVASHQGPPPQVAFHQGPPQQVASHQGPSPQVASYQGPSPQVASYQGPPPQVASHQGPPPQVASHQGPPQQQQQPYQQLTVNGATCEQELNMMDKSTTRKRRSAEAALDKDDKLLQDESQTKKIKDIVEDEDALMGNSDGEENLNDTGFLDEQNYNLREDVGIEEEDPVYPPRLNEQVDASEGLQVFTDTGDNLNVNVPDNSQVNDLNMTGENQSFESQPSTTDPISSTPLTTLKSEKPKPSPPREEETSMVDADTTGPDEDEEEDPENDLEQQQQPTSQSWSSTPPQQQHQVAVSSGPPRASSRELGYQSPHLGSRSSILTNYLKSDTKRTELTIANLESRFVKHFDICYYLAKHGLPFSHYPSLVNLETRHGVELGSMIEKPVQAKAFTYTMFLAKDIRIGVDEAVRKARYMSILIDRSTDRSTSGKELMYVKYLEDGIPRTRYFSILKSANADRILEALNTTFQEHNIPDWKNKLIGFCTDGARVNFRCREGAVAKLAAEMPWLLDIHCTAHQLELDSKDAFEDSYFSKEIDPFLTSFANLYVQSDGSFWVYQRKRALQRLEGNYQKCVDHLTALGMDKRSKMKDVAAKARGMVEKMSSYKFVLHMALYIDLLEELSHLSFELQQNDICLSTVREHLGTALSALTEIAGGRDGVKLQSIKNSCVKGIYQGVTLSGMEDSSAEFDATLNDLVQPLVRCIGQRFCSFTGNNVFSALSSLDPKTWPNELTGFDFSDRDAQILIKHFNDTLVAHGCDPDQAKSEWVRLKKVIPTYYKPTITWQALWGTLFQERQEDFPNFLHIIEMIQVLSFATEKVERGFSLMNRMKSDWRVCLKACMLDDLMMINLEGPPEEEYTTNSAVARWRRAVKKSRRPYVQP